MVLVVAPDAVDAVLEGGGSGAYRIGEVVSGSGVIRT